jgi:hypothetical protein
VVLEGRSAPENILLVLPERQEAETIAAEVRKKGHRVVVRPYGPESPDDRTERSYPPLPLADSPGDG